MTVGVAWENKIHSKYSMQFYYLEKITLQCRLSSDLKEGSWELISNLFSVRVCQNVACRQSNCCKFKKNEISFLAFMLRKG